MTKMEQNDYEWVSPSTLARRLGISTQMVYIRIKQGMYEAQQFDRGSMNGWLVKARKEDTEDIEHDECLLG